MTDKQPEALRLADELTRAVDLEDPEDQTVMVARWFVEDAAAELRRLHEQNERLRGCLYDIAEHDHDLKCPNRPYEWIAMLRGCARAALAKETT